MGRLIREGAVNRLGMALTGFIKYFAFRRVQLIGKSEISYFQSLDSETRQARIRGILDKKIPCIVFSRDNRPPAIILKEAQKAKVPVFISPDSNASAGEFDHAMFGGGFRALDQ